MNYDLSKYELSKEVNAFFSGFETFEEAWNACKRGDWMLEIAYKVGVGIKVLTLAKGLCANTVRHLMKDKRNIDAVDGAIAFGNGEITEEELELLRFPDDAYADAIDAIDSIYAYDTAYSAISTNCTATATYANYAAATSAYAFATTAAAAYYAYGTYADAYATAEKENQLQTANICREVLTQEVFNNLKITK